MANNRAHRTLGPGCLASSISDGSFFRIDRMRSSCRITKCLYSSMGNMESLRRLYLNMANSIAPEILGPIELIIGE